jgi:nitronate monooxygenase
MGIAVSGWPLARTVAMAGQLGVVSGTAIDNVFVRRLQDHGVDDTLRAVLDRFPVHSIVDEILARFTATRRALRDSYQNLLMLTHRSPKQSEDLLVLSSFVEVGLAKHGHDGTVGMNLLTKVQLPTAPTLLGAMLADADYILMGAGVPTHIPGVLDRLSRGEPVDMPLDVSGTPSGTKSLSIRFDPSRFLAAHKPHRPKFLGIVSSHVLATALAKRSDGAVDGFVVERPVAGGHNAPPRGQFTVDAQGNPEYGERDRVDYDVMGRLSQPFWIAGGISTREHVREALELGATGVQVGTLFAYADESGMDPTLRRSVVAQVNAGTVHVRTSLRASSTGYPFKVAEMPGTVATKDVYDARERKCDLGYLRQAYTKESGGIGYRCAAEPVSAYVRKGGRLEDTEGSQCLCNGLMAACGLGQVRADGRVEPPIVTSGDCINEIRTLAAGRDGYRAAEVIAHLDPTRDFEPAPIAVDEHAGAALADA